MRGQCGRLNVFDQRYLLKKRGEKQLGAEVGGREVGGVRGDEVLAGPGAANHLDGEEAVWSACPAPPNRHLPWNTEKSRGEVGGMGVMSFGEAAACISPASFAPPH